MLAEKAFRQCVHWGGATGCDVWADAVVLINSAKFKKSAEIKNAWRAQAKSRAQARPTEQRHDRRGQVHGAGRRNAIGVLVNAMEGRSVPWSCRIQAASLVADRAFGRARQSVSLEVMRGSTI
jgi:hypothetical protein